MLEEHSLNADVLSLFDFIQHAIEGREYAKFVFTHTLSDVLELLAELGAAYGLDREAMSHVNIRRIMESYSQAGDMERILRDSIREGQAQEAAASGITLPPLLWEERQIYGFFLPDGAPNFITQGRSGLPATPQRSGWKLIVEIGRWLFYETGIHHPTGGVD